MCEAHLLLISIGWIPFIMNTERRLKRINSAYNGNGDKELALFLTDRWVLYVGNPSDHVRLGEVEGDHCFEGFKLEDVLSAAENELLSNNLLE